MCRIHLFRDSRVSAGETVVAAAPAGATIAAFGGGDLHQTEGLTRAFGVGAFFRDDTTGETWFGVWGARNAARFRRALRRSQPALETVRTPPSARLVWWATMSARPERVKPNFGI